MIDHATIGLAISLVNSGLQWILKTRAAAMQSGEWTLAQEQDFQEKIVRKMSEPHWQPDSPTGT